MQVKVGSTGLRSTPAPDGSLETELLFGEEFIVEKERNGWAYGRAKLDNYPGYVALSALADPGPRPTHRISAARTIVYAGNDCKSAPRMWLSMNALVRVCSSAPPTQGYEKIVGGGWVFSKHLRPVGVSASDWVAEAEKFIGSNYFWGGRDANHGLDCSAVIQNALLAAGHSVPRNSNQQERALISRLDLDRFSLSNVERGELIFWNGHVGVMRDEEQLLHATGEFMEVVSEPLSEVVARRKRLPGGNVTAVGRLA